MRKLVNYSIAFDDMLSALRQAGYKIPEDAVLCCGNSDVSQGVMKFLLHSDEFYEVKPRTDPPSMQLTPVELPVADYNSQFLSSFGEDSQEKESEEYEIVGDAVVHIDCDESVPGGKTSLTWTTDGVSYRCKFEDAGVDVVDGGESPRIVANACGESSVFEVYVETKDGQPVHIYCDEFTKFDCDLGMFIGDIEEKYKCGNHIYKYCKEKNEKLSWVTVITEQNKITEIKWIDENDNDYLLENFSCADFLYSVDANYTRHLKVIEDKGSYYNPYFAVRVNGDLKDDHVASQDCYVLDVLLNEVEDRYCATEFIGDGKFRVDGKVYCVSHTSDPNKMTLSWYSRGLSYAVVFDLPDGENTHSGIYVEDGVCMLCVKCKDKGVYYLWVDGYLKSIVPYVCNEHRVCVDTFARNRESDFENEEFTVRLTWNDSKVYVTKEANEVENISWNYEGKQYEINHFRGGLFTHLNENGEHVIKVKHDERSTHKSCECDVRVNESWKKDILFVDGVHTLFGLLEEAVACEKPVMQTQYVAGDYVVQVKYQEGGEQWHTDHRQVSAIKWTAGDKQFVIEDFDGCNFYVRKTDDGKPQLTSVYRKKREKPSYKIKVDGMRTHTTDWSNSFTFDLSFILDNAHVIHQKYLKENSQDVFTNYTWTDDYVTWECQMIKFNAASNCVRKIIVGKRNEINHFTFEFEDGDVTFDGRAFGGYPIFIMQKDEMPVVISKLYGNKKPDLHHTQPGKGDISVVTDPVEFYGWAESLYANSDVHRYDVGTYTYIMESKNGFTKLLSWKDSQGHKFELKNFTGGSFTTKELNELPHLEVITNGDQQSAHYELFVDGEFIETVSRGSFCNSYGLLAASNAARYENHLAEQRKPVKVYLENQFDHATHFIRCGDANYQVTLDDDNSVKLITYQRGVNTFTGEFVKGKYRIYAVDGVFHFESNHDIPDDSVEYTMSINGIVTQKDWVVDVEDEPLSGWFSRIVESASMNKPHYLKQEVASDDD